MVPKLTWGLLRMRCGFVVVPPGCVGGSALGHRYFDVNVNSCVNKRDKVN